MLDDNPRKELEYFAAAVLLPKCTSTPCTIKKDPQHFFSHNSTKNCQILIIFGRYINKRLGNHKIVYFPTSPK